MRLQLIGGDDLLARGVTNLQVMRPVLAPNAGLEEMFVGNATLRYLEWQHIDAKVNEVLRTRLTVADDMRAAGMVTPVGLGTILRITERMDDMTEAELSFDGDTAPEGDRPGFEHDTIPVPVLAKDFRINWRQLEASRTKGMPLDTTGALIAARKVRDLLQNTITNGYSKLGPGGNTIPGLTTAANRIQVTPFTAWDTSGADPVSDVEKMLAAAYNSNLFGPFVLYIPRNYWATVQQDYILTGGNVAVQTYIARFKQFVDIVNVRPNDSLANDNVVMVQMTPDTMDFSEAQAVTTVQWEKNPFVTYFRVLMVGGPQIKSMQTDQGTTVHGIIHLHN